MCWFRFLRDTKETLMTERMDLKEMNTSLHVSKT